MQMSVETAADFIFFQQCQNLGTFVALIPWRIMEKHELLLLPFPAEIPESYKGTVIVDGGGDEALVWLSDGTRPWPQEGMLVGVSRLGRPPGPEGTRGAAPSWAALGKVFNPL